MQTFECRYLELTKFYHRMVEASQYDSLDLTVEEINQIRKNIYEAQARISPLYIKRGRWKLMLFYFILIFGISSAMFCTVLMVFTGYVYFPQSTVIACWSSVIIIIALNETVIVNVDKTSLNLYLKRLIHEAVMKKLL